MAADPLFLRKRIRQKFASKEQRRLQLRPLRRRRRGGRNPTVASALLVDSSPRAGQLVAELSAEGYRARGAVSPLEAIWLLTGSGAEPVTVFLGEPAGSADSEQLAAHLERHFPNVRVSFLGSGEG